MPHIEVLPTTSKAAAPGWSYVLDTGYDPSKAAINPSSRKRARFAPSGPSASDLSSRQQTAITRHLDELDKDSHKTVVVGVPSSSKGGGVKGRKQTVNTRRILGSGKDFGHYLDQEEALGKTGAVPAGAAVGEAQEEGKVQRASKTPIARRKTLVEATPVAVSTTTAGPPTTTQKIPERLRECFGTEAQGTDEGLLVQKVVLEGVTVTEVESLLQAQPLSYVAARSGPGTEGTPRRVFCEICGFWGRVRCLKCGSRVCGLECKGVHEESRCVRF